MTSSFTAKQGRLSTFPGSRNMERDAVAVERSRRKSSAPKGSESLQTLRVVLGGNDPIDPLQKKAHEEKRRGAARESATDPDDVRCPELSSFSSLLRDSDVMT
jgi:hypothetical protein